MRKVLGAAGLALTLWATQAVWGQDAAHGAKGAGVPPGPFQYHLATADAPATPLGGYQESKPFRLSDWVPSFLSSKPAPKPAKKKPPTKTVKRQPQ